LIHCPPPRQLLYSERVITNVRFQNLDGAGNPGFDYGEQSCPEAGLFARNATRHLDEHGWHRTVQESGLFTITPKADGWQHDGPGSPAVISDYAVVVKVKGDEVVKFHVHLEDLF
jgi:hypothetical protein